MPHASIIDPDKDREFDWTYARSLCNTHNLVFSDDIADMADKELYKVGLGQNDMNVLVGLHIHVTAHLFDRQNYKWYHRIVIALYWLGVGKRVKSRR